jgi:uncharacterized protein (DUF433 family)
MESAGLECWEDGTIRIAGSRVPFDHIVDSWAHGETPEAIVQEIFPSLELSDVYAAIAYYLRHREEVDAYLCDRRERREEAVAELLRLFPQEGIRERLLARRAPSE